MIPRKLLIMTFPDHDAVKEGGYFLMLKKILAIPITVLEDGR
jgi:hypothetical protein